VKDFKSNIIGQVKFWKAIINGKMSQKGKKRGKKYLEDFKNTPQKYCFILVNMVSL